MATYYRNIKDPTRPAIKIIRLEEGRVIVHYAGVADAALLLAYVFGPSKCRHQARRMTQAEIDRVWLEQGQLNLGAGI